MTDITTHLKHVRRFTDDDRAAFPAVDPDPEYGAPLIAHRTVYIEGRPYEVAFMAYSDGLVAHVLDDLGEGRNDWSYVDTLLALPDEEVEPFPRAAAKLELLAAYPETLTVEFLGQLGLVEVN